MFPFYNLFKYAKFVQYILQTQVQDMAYTQFNILIVHFAMKF